MNNIKKPTVSVLLNDAEDITLEYSAFDLDIRENNFSAFKIKSNKMNGGMIDDTPRGATVVAREVDQSLWSSGLNKNQYGFIIITNNNMLFEDIVDFDKDSMSIKCHGRNTSTKYSGFKLPLGYREGCENYVSQIFQVLKRHHI